MRLHSFLRTALVLVFMLINQMASAQEFDSELLTRRMYARINEVNENISMMSDKSKDLSTREYYKNRALSLFYNHGDNYIVPFGSQQKIIKIVFKYGNRNICRDVKAYFTGLVNFRYTSVKINSVNILSSCNVEFDLNTFILSPKSFNLSDLEKFENDIYVLPCKIAKRDENNMVDAELYLMGINTIDGVELVPLITGLKGIYDDKDR